MNQLKKMLRKHEKPLQQIANRYEDKLKNYNMVKLNPNNDKIVTLNVLHSNGPILNNIDNSQNKKLKIGSILINISNKADCYVMTKKSEIIKVINIAHLILDDKTVILGQMFMDKQLLYLRPLKSSILDVYLVDKLSTSLKCWNILDIYKKMMIFSFKS